jgi:Zn finger protein HypA/HybF involved in hydrogenase expression
MKYLGTTIPHSDFGAPDCCGCLNGIIEDDQGRVECNECGEVLRRAPPAELRAILHQMELSLDLLTALCPHCRAVNLFAGFEQIIAFVCKECGRGVELS